MSQTGGSFEPEHAAYDLEVRLAKTVPAERRQRGVFYTPQAVATAIVRRVDLLLRCRLGLPLGLADPRRWGDYRCGSEVSQSLAKVPVVNVLEPAAGSGIFLAAVVRQMHANLTEHSRRCGKDSLAVHAIWQRYLAEDVPHRLTGIELMPQAIEAARTLLGQVAEETGLSARDADTIPLVCANALQPEVHSQLTRPVTVVLGNPPYAAASTNTSTWIRNLLRGWVEGDAQFRSYFHADGDRLQERKLWLHDDYVKFLRVAQWHIEKAGLGVIGFVTNRGFLDNVTFRGLRYQLLDQFDQIEILDLNGGGKNRGAAARLSRDESVFDVGQGVAISVLCQTPLKEEVPTDVKFGSLWGSRASKLAELAEKSWTNLLPEIVSSAAPHYFLLPHRDELRDEYRQGIPATQLFPHHTSTLVTARDALVIDTNRERLLARMAAFRDSRLTDEQLRAQFFPRPRSSKYPPGDTRGWKLSVAREQLRADVNWHQRIVPCTYRPFDRRWIYWSNTMIDWPRGKVMEEMGTPGAVGLIVRRQMPPDRPCTFFFVSDSRTVDGILRSDNRGNETLIPRYVNGTENLQRGLVPERFRTEPVESVFAYVYGLLHSSAYREHFAQQLRLDFPRVFFPRQPSTWSALAEQGQRLLDLHLTKWSDSDLQEDKACPGGTVAAGFPKWRDGQVWINPDTAVAEIAEADWLFHIGGHQVLRKWLKDRRHMVLESSEIQRYRQIGGIIHETRRAMRQIDGAIEKLGGLHRAFLIEPIGDI